MPTPTRRQAAQKQPRIAWPMIVFALVLVGGGVAYGVSQAGKGSPGPDGDNSNALEPAKPLERTGSTEVTSGPAPTALTLDGQLATYRITYQVSLFGADAVEESLTVRRPFDSRVEREIPGGEQAQETSFGRTVLQRPDQSTLIEGTPVAPDRRPDVVIGDAVELGLAERRERRMVAGRECDVYRTSSSGSAFSAVYSDSDHLDTCVDEAGLVLEEWEVSGGTPIRQKLAREVTVDVALADGDFAKIADPERIPLDKGGGSIRGVEPTSEPTGTFYVLDTPPAGFEFKGRYNLVPPQEALADPDKRSTAVAATADVYVSGTQFVVIERGGTLGQQAAFDPPPAERSVDAGPLLGTAERILGYTGPEVRVPLASGRFVRVYGAAPLEVVLGVARSLRETPGGSGLVFLEPAPG